MREFPTLSHRAQSTHLLFYTVCHALASRHNAKVFYQDGLAVSPTHLPAERFPEVDCPIQHFALRLASCQNAATLVFLLVGANQQYFLRHSSRNQNTPVAGH